jgi:hypothetical protein
MSLKNLPLSPVNAQAAKFLSKGNSRLTTIEAAMEGVARIITDKDHIAEMRKNCDKQVCNEYRIRIYKRGDGLPGYKVAVKFFEIQRWANVAGFSDLI